MIILVSAFGKHEILKMIKSIVLLVCLLSTILLSSCGTGDKPRVVAQKFLEAGASEKWAEAKKYCTPETGVQLDELSKSPGYSKDKKKRIYNMLEERVVGDEAEVDYKVNDDTPLQTLKLKKVNGKWLVGM